MYTYNTKLVRVIDGDTIVFNIDMGFKTWVNDEHVRLARINAPEPRTLDLVEKARGIAATIFVEEQLKNCLDGGGSVVLKTFKDHGKFGRYIADVYLNYNGDDTTEQVLLNDLLVTEGHAVYKEY